MHTSIQLLSGRALRTVGVQGFAKQERTARRSQNEDREDCKEDHPGNDLQKGGKLAASRQTLPHTCRLFFTSEHCRKHKKAERLLEEPSLEAALITFLLKSTFFFDFLLFLQNAKAAKEGAGKKQAFQENLHRNEPNERKINKNEQNKSFALNFSFAPKDEKTV